MYERDCVVAACTCLRDYLAVCCESHDTQEWVLCSHALLLDISPQSSVFGVCLCTFGPMWMDGWMTDSFLAECRLSRAACVYLRFFGVCICLSAWPSARLPDKSDME